MAANDVAPQSSSTSLFDETFMRRLERLSLIARRIRAGRGDGERRSTKRGSSVEFADYRNYTPGDDLRRLDWRVYARLERPFIKLFEEEEEQTVHLLLDASGSMNWPADEMAVNKWAFGRKLVAALGYIALAQGDRLIVSHLNTEGHHSWGPQRGKGHIHGLLNHLTDLPASGATDLNISLRQAAQTRQRTGLLFLLTDFFSPNGYEQGISALGNAGHEINILHLLSPDEIDPPLTGDLRLYDTETEATQEITINPTMRRLYRERLAAWQADIERTCFSRNINYIQLNTSLAFEAVIFNYLQQRGFVR
ncbi:MAG: DUF58 domain-containing protein [Chloroflexota bacterium]